MEANQDAKLAYERAAFAAVRERVEFIRTLSHRPFEARLLTVVALDGLSNRLYGAAKRKNESGFRFTKMLIELGNDERYGLMVGNWWHRNLPRSNIRSAHHNDIERFAFATPANQAWDREAFLNLAREWVTQETLGAIDPYLYRGTVAYQVYKDLRNVPVHEMGAFTGISFESFTRNGRSVGVISYETLYDSLVHILNHVQANTLDRGIVFWS